MGCCFTVEARKVEVGREVEEVVGEVLGSYNDTQRPTDQIWSMAR